MDTQMQKQPNAEWQVDRQQELVGSKLGVENNLRTDRPKGDLEGLHDRFVDVVAALDQIERRTKVIANYVYGPQPEKGVGVIDTRPPFRGIDALNEVSVRIYNIIDNIEHQLARLEDL